MTGPFKTYSLKQFFNVVLRLVSLIAKLGLTLYMGRYLGLEDMGIYGLVFGAVMILSGALGLRLDYVVSRDIVGTTPENTLVTMRDQTVFLLFNYLLLALVMLAVIMSNLTGVDGKILLTIIMLSIVENLASAAQINMTSLDQPVLANFLFFIRSASWVFPVVILGMLSPSYRNVDFIFKCWMLGVVASVALNLWCWRNLPWTALKHHPIHWNWIKEGVKKSFLIWLGTMGLAAGMYVDRFIVMKFLGLDEVGIATFYFSFTFALLTLLHSGVMAFFYPRLIKLYRKNNEAGFRKEMRQTGLQTAISAAVIAAGIGIGVPLIGHFFNRPELVREAKTLWLMLAGTWIRANAETLYYVLFARNQDKAIWLGNLLFLIPAFGCNVLLIPVFGLEGIGYGTIIAALFLLLWRAWYVFGPKQAQLAH